MDAWGGWIKIDRDVWVDGQMDEWIGNGLMEG